MFFLPFYLTGPLGAISNLAAAGPQATTHPSTALSEANSAATSRTGSKENLCEECIQNPLDLIDASIQVHFQPFISVLSAQFFFFSVYFSICSVAHQQILVFQNLLGHPVYSLLLLMVLPT